MPCLLPINTALYIWCTSIRGRTSLPCLTSILKAFLLWCNTANSRAVDPPWEDYMQKVLPWIKQNMICIIMYIVILLTSCVLLMSMLSFRTCRYCRRVPTILFFLDITATCRGLNPRWEKKCTVTKKVIISPCNTCKRAQRAIALRISALLHLLLLTGSEQILCRYPDIAYTVPKVLQIRSLAL